MDSDVATPAFGKSKASPASGRTSVEGRDGSHHAVGKDPSQALGAARPFVLWGVYAVLIQMVVGSFVAPPGICGFEYAPFPDMVYGTAVKPYVLRTLVPTLDRLITSALPASLRDMIVHQASHESVAHALTKMTLAPRYLPELLVAVVLLDLSLLVFVVSLRSLARSTYGKNPWMVDFAPIVALVLVPCCFAYENYVYDFATLGLFTAGLALMVRERFAAYLALFVVACINKETTILLTLIFGLYFRILAPGQRKYLALAAAQIGVFVVIKAGLGYVFRNNPGTTAEFHLFNHNLLFPTYHMGTAMGWLGFSGLIAYGWSAKPRFLKTALSIMIPLVGLTFFLGYLDEIRDYYEAFPAAFLLASETVARLFGVLGPSAGPATASSAA